MRPGRIILAALLVAAPVTGCGDVRESPDGSGSDTVQGVVLEVKGDLRSVDSFVIRTDGGEVLEVAPAPEGDFRFPLPHLRDHLITSEPILVELDRTVDPPLATAIADADDPAWYGGQTVAPGDSTHPIDINNANDINDNNADPPTRTVGSTSAPTTEDPDRPAEPSADGPDREKSPDPASNSATTVTPSTLPPAPETTEAPATSATDPPPVTTTTPPPSTQPAQASPPEGALIELLLIDGALEGGARRESVALGDTVTLRVRGNTADEVHVHGYDLYLHLVEGGGELTFEADIPGVFEIELEGSHTLLIRLEVS